MSGRQRLGACAWPISFTHPPPPPPPQSSPARRRGSSSDATIRQSSPQHLSSDIVTSLLVATLLHQQLHHPRTTPSTVIKASSAFYDRRSSQSHCTDAFPASLYRSSRWPEAPHHEALLILLFANLVRRSSLTPLRSLVVLKNQHREVTSDPCVPSSRRLRRSIFYPQFEGRRTVQLIYTLPPIIYV
jgi:hypothetical protein